VKDRRFSTQDYCLAKQRAAGFGSKNRKDSMVGKTSSRWCTDPGGGGAVKFSPVSCFASLRSKAFTTCL